MPRGLTSCAVLRGRLAREERRLAALEARGERAREVESRRERRAAKRPRGTGTRLAAPAAEREPAVAHASSVPPASEAREAAAVDAILAAHGRDPAKILHAWQRLRHEQDALYEKRSKLRRGERTARKAALENKLDANAAKLSALADAHVGLTGLSPDLETTATTAPPAPRADAERQYRPTRTATITIYRDVPEGAPAWRGKLVRAVEGEAASETHGASPHPLFLARVERTLRPGQALDFSAPLPGRHERDGVRLGAVKWDDAMTLARRAVAEAKGNDARARELFHAWRERFERTVEAAPVERRFSAEAWLAAMLPDPPRSAKAPPRGRDYKPGGLQHHDDERRTRQRVMDSMRQATYEGGVVEAEADGQVWEMLYSPDDPRKWEGDYVLMPHGRVDQITRADSLEGLAYKALQVFGPKGPERMRVRTIFDEVERIDPLAARVRVALAHRRGSGAA